MNKTVAIVGRPNVGKSTFFNRMIGQRKAIVDDLSGVTRDRMYGEVEWNGKRFDIIDTGGYVEHTSDLFETAIKDQVKIAIDEAQLIIFMVDVTTGITHLDDEVADLLRKSKKDVIVLVNKVDNNTRLHQTSEFYSLGFEQLFPVSSISGSGTGEILDAITDTLPYEEEEEENEIFIPKIAIVGQPNVGKSSMVNALLGEDRNIVTNIAGTTRDAINSLYKKYDREFIFVDTAGIRKKNKVHEDLEFYSVIRAIKSIDQADIVLLMIDAAAGIESQDMSLFKIIQRKKKGVAIIVNKWDTVEKSTNTMKEYEEAIRKKIAPFDNVPILFTSVLEKQRIFNVLETVDTIVKSMNTKITTSELNDFILDEVIKSTPPPSYRGTLIKIKYATQLPSKNPTFAFFCNYPKQVPDNYKKFLKNKIKERYNFMGTQIQILMKKK